MKITTKQICLTAVAAAFTFVVTRFIQIPIPLGYFNIGNSIILSFCLLLPLPCGVGAAAIGSALADLTSYPVYTIPTLVIKAIFPLLYYLLVRLPIKNNYLKNLFAASVSTLIPLFGYTLTGCILYGFAAGVAQFPGLLLEYVANLAIFAALIVPLGRVKKLMNF